MVESIQLAAKMVDFLLKDKSTTLMYSPLLVMKASPENLAASLRLNYPNDTKR
jgi:hypothetical protein